MRSSCILEKNSFQLEELECSVLLREGGSRMYPAAATTHQHLSSCDVRNGAKQM